MAIAAGTLTILTATTGRSETTSVAGDYQLLDDQVIKIRQQGDRLTCSIADQAPTAMQVLHQRTYRVGDLDTTLVFHPKGPREVASLEITRFGQRVVAPRLTSNKPLALRPVPSEPTVKMLDDLVPRLMILHHVPGVSIVGIDHHRLAWHRQYGLCRADRNRKVDKDTLFEACSMTKPVFAYAVLRLIEQGRLDLDKPLLEYLGKPYLPDEPRHRAITARMVLCHTSGLPNVRKKGELLHVLFKPGSRFEYSGEGFKYLQHVVEHVTGMSADRWMRKTLFDPVGMKTSSLAWNDRVANLVAAGHGNRGHVKTAGPRFRRANAAASLFCSPSEYALFLLEIMRKDRSADHSLGKSMIEQMLTRASKADPRRPVKRLSPSTSRDVHYGLGWQINATRLGDRFYHGGANGTGFRCYSEFDPRRGSGIVIMTNGLGGKRLWKAVVARMAP